MKIKTNVRLLTLGVLTLALSLPPSALLQAAPLGPAFTYQGRLHDGGVPAQGSYDLRFTMYAAAGGGSAVAAPLTNGPVAVTNGLFTVTLDFGEGVFTGDARWLEIAARTNGIAGDFTALTPRQLLTPSPYALFAPSAGVAASAATASTVVAGGVANTSLQANAVTSDKIADGTVTAADVNAASFNTTFWRATGNAGTTPGTHFLGTTDNQPLELRVNSLRALRLEDNGDGSDAGTTPDGAPNLIGGAPVNWVAAGVVGATISGGGASDYEGVPLPHSIASDYGAIGGGLANAIGSNSWFATIAGGHLNIIADDASQATIAGGSRNDIGPNAVYATIAGGNDNTIAFSSQYSAIGGGSYNEISTNASSAVIGGGIGNRVAASLSAVGGGAANRIAEGSAQAFIGAGESNDIGTNSPYSVIGGGYDNQVADYGRYATVPGGRQNVAGHLAFAAGNRAKATHLGAFVWADSENADFDSTVENEFSVRAGGGARFVTDGAGMTLDGQPVFAGSDGAALTNLNASQLTVGAVPDALLSANVSRLGQSIESAEITDGTIVNADISPVAAIADAKLATIATAGKVANSATTATSANTPNTIVARDASGNLTAGAITAAFSGSGAGLTSLNAGQLTSGAVPDARLAANVARTNQVWLLGGNAGTSPGTHFLGTRDNQPVEIRAKGQRALRLEPTGSNDTVNVIGGSARNFVAAGVVGATIGGGGSGNHFGVARTNSVAADFGTIGGGIYNTIQTNAQYATIGGGYVNTIETHAWVATIGGGFANTIQTNADYATIGGGSNNKIQTNAEYATIPGGRNNSATNFAFAAGHRAKANHTGAFVWADSTDADYASTAANQFRVRAGGGVFIQAQASGLNPAACRIESTTGNGVGLFVSQGSTDASLVTANTGPGDLIKGYYGAGGGTLAFRVDNDGDVTAKTFTPSSDRNLKENLAPVDAQDILARVAALPIARWNFKQDSAPHVGPMAQDFHAAFGLGADDRHIATVDADGVALAAIQGLNQKLDARSQELEAENAELKERLARLEQLVQQLTQ